MAVVAVAGMGAATAAADVAAADTAAGLVRIATFNTSLSRPREGELRRALATGDDTQARAVAGIIRRMRPDILLLQEFDFDADGEALRGFQSNYLGDAAYPFHFLAPSNTGVPSGQDLDRDGKTDGPADALGFGEFPGQYGMVLLSRFPIDAAAARRFRKLPWRDMPGALLPADWYAAEARAILPLSSKSHWDVPVRVGSRTLHVLASHPTPPTFDGPEDRNGRRNHDEIRFWVDYLTRGAAGYIHDDGGARGGFEGRHFVILGDQNSDPNDGASLSAAIRLLLAHPRVDASFMPLSAGAMEAAAAQGGVNAAQRGDPRADTADFDDRTAGNLRADYLLPSRTLRVCGGGVFWPRSDAPEAALVWGTPPPSSDHRLVWLDVSANEARCPPDSDPTASGSARLPR